ncbi:hypothetical protein BN2497_1539 [Janthinobacterium sp. CG23_2]|nr:hypothetical protein BN2497_1539 [Janthinobacterium sp. CG23_2]CUU27167.1 hypothetical protein BN3177_1539 [Janthinobacterium sp. CG23_2]
MGAKVESILLPGIAHPRDADGWVDLRVHDLLCKLAFTAHDGPFQGSSVAPLIAVRTPVRPLRQVHGQ